MSKRKSKTQLPIEFPAYIDYSGRKVLIPQSAGINSAASLCWLAQAPEAMKPAEVHIFYAHLEEHSPGSREFVWAMAAYARQHFAQVFYTETEASVLDFFESQNMIPHPSVAPCTRLLKLEPMYAYMAAHGIVDNVVGYVETEQRRIGNMAKRGEKTPNGVLMESGIESQFPIAQFSNEWCFVIVDREIGWHPAIYDIRDAKGNRVFSNNNCLPCKNMTDAQLLTVDEYFPDYMARAHALSLKLEKHWGRNADSYYTQFGRPNYEVPNGQPCAHCAKD